MARPSKPKKNANTEAWRTNVLLEEIRTEISRLAEGQRSLRAEFGSFKLALEDIDKRLQNIGPIVQTLRSVPNQLEVLLKHVAHIEEGMKDIKEKLDTYDQRLTAVEGR